MDLATARRCLADLASYSRLVIGTPLRPYQLEAGDAIVAAAMARAPRDLRVVLMARQAGKNELSAQVEAYLLDLFADRGGTIVKCAPTFRPQLHTSMQRLSERAQTALTRARARQGFELVVGRARAQFLSAAPTSRVVGATASIMLEVDEAQDCDEEKLARDFYPMTASTNAPRVYYGTAWTPEDALQQARRVAERLERRDGVRRVFAFPWWVVAEHNPAYGRHVEAERARLGASHPLFRTQYALEPISTADRLLDEAQLRRLQGEHPALAGPTAGRRYVAGVDLAGPAEAEPGRPREVDRTAVTVAEVDRGASGPRARVVAGHVWAGKAHREQLPALVGLLRDWGVASAAVDATGLGQPIADLLVAALGRHRVRPVTLTAQSKSELGYGLLSAINGRALTLPAADRDREPWRTYWREAAACERRLRAGGLMGWQAPAGEHEDTLVSLALAWRAAEGVPAAPVAGLIAAVDRYADEDDRG